jgi:hypothetical protein
MLRIDADAVAVRGGAVPEHDASDAVARWRSEMSRIAALVVDDRRHDLSPHMQRFRKGDHLTKRHARVTCLQTARPRVT